MLTYLLPPLFGGVIGYITNDIAIRMLFRPHRTIYVCGVRIPFTPGIIPKEKGRIARAMGEAISENLMNKEVLERTLLSNDITSQITNTIDTFCYNQKKNDETVRDFVSHYLTKREMSSLVEIATNELEKLISGKLAESNFGNAIAKMAIEHAVGKVTEGLLGVMGANIIIEPIRAIAEPLLAKEINHMIQENSAPIVHTLIQDQITGFLDTAMKKLFLEHDQEISQAKEMILSVYRVMILEQLPKILASLNISRMIEERINEMDMCEIEPIIIKVMDKELRAVVWFGAGLGTLIGCVNLFINT